MGTNKLVNKINKWYNINPEAYKIIFSLAQERFNDIVSESESITDKSLKMLSTILAIVSAIALYLSRDIEIIKNNISLISILGIFIAINIALLIFLILPKYVNNKGLPPEVSMVDNFDDENDKEYQLQKLYYNGIHVLQQNIDYMDSKNNKRASVYKYTLLLFFGLIGSIPLVLLYFIST